MDKRTCITNVKCPRCREYMLLSPISDYRLTCESCCEDFYEIEVHEIIGDYFEISINMSIDEYKTMLEDIKKTFKDSCFIGYDDVKGVCDIGFKDIPTSERIKYIIKYFNIVEI